MTQTQGRGGWASPAVRLAAGAIALWAAWVLARRLSMLWILVIFSTLLSYLLLPLVRFLEKRIPKAAATPVALFAPILLIAAFGAFFLPRLVQETFSALSLVPQRVEGLLEAVHALCQRIGLDVDWQMSHLGSALGPEVLTRGFAWLRDLLAGQGYILLLTPILSFYWLRDRVRIYRQILFLLPVKHRPAIARVALLIHDRLQAYLLGQLLSASLVGLVTGAGLWLFRVPFAAAGGAIMAVLDLIPSFGPVVATVLICLVTLAVEPGKVLTALLLCLAAQQMESAWVVPTVLGDSLQLHPACVMLVILAGGMLGGALGMLSAIPVYLCLREILRAFGQRLYSKACKTAPGSVE